MFNTQKPAGPELPKQDAYDQALNMALEVFERKDPRGVAEKAAARFEDRILIVPHLDREILFDPGARSFSIRETGEPAPTWLAILLLHYLNSADGRSPTGKLKHFREFKEGQFYEPAFNRRTKDILIAAYGDNSTRMIAGGEVLKGKILPMGDAAVELTFFPYLPITCILWLSDEDFPAEAGVLFDETADLFFSAEDMAVAGQMAVLELLKASSV